MKILYIDTELVWRGGQEQLFGLMTGMQERGHEVWLAAPPASPLAQKAQQQQLMAYPFRQRSEFSGLAFWRLLQLCRRENFDIVHFNTPRAILTGGMAARLSKIPLIVCSRRVNFPLRSRLSVLKYRHLLDRVYTVSVSIQRTLVQSGLEPERLEVIYEGVDLDWIDRQHTDRTCSKGGNPVVGTVAHLSQEKGHSTLLEAAHQLNRQLSEACFLLVGDGPLQGELVKQARRLGIDHQILFTGFRSDSEALMKQFDIFCLPSLSEGLSSAILAAMASRLPVVATNVGGIPELVQDQVTGYLVPPRDSTALARALRRLVDSAQLRRQMGEAGRMRIEQQFTLKQKMERTEASYRELLQKGGFR